MSLFSTTPKKFSLVLLLSSIVFNAYSQGPGGVDSNLQLWFKSDVGAEVSTGVIATDGQTIEFWRDQSGNTFDAEQGASGNRPTIDFTNTINGNPVLQFNGSGDNLPITTLEYPSGTTPSAITIYSVVTTTNTVEGIILSYDRNEYFRFATNHEEDGGFGLSTTNSSGTIDDFNASGSPENDGIPHILSGSFDPSISGTNKFLYFDGTITNSTDAGTTTFGSGNTRFGFIGAGSEADGFDGTEGPTDAYLDGSLGEVIYFGGALTPTQRQQVESYLAIKYGITLSADTDGDATAFEAGEGDYIGSDGTTVFWDASVNELYHNDIAVIANDLDSELSQASSKSINEGSIISMTDNGLADGDFIAWGNNNANLSSSTAAGSSLGRMLDRVWKVEITGATDNIDDITYDLSNLPETYLNATNYAILIDDNLSFSSPVEVTGGTLLGTDVSFSNVDFSSLIGGDVFITLAVDLPLPGGVGDGLTFWFKGDAGVEAAASDEAEDGEAVQFWNDQISGFDAQQDDSGERPTLVENSFNFNPGISFNGSTHLPISDLNYDLTTNTLTEFTIYSIARSSQTTEGIIVSYDRSSFFRFGLNQQGTNFGLGTAIESDIDDFNASTSAEDGETHLIGADYSATTNIKNLFLDGVVDATRTTAHSPSGATLGNSSEVPRFGYIGANSEADAFNNNDGGDGINGLIGEIIYFESILLPTERNQVESYLAIKYGITLTSDYIASDGATVIWNNATNTGYNNMITAIGLDENSTLSQSQSKSENSSSVLTVSDASLTDGDYVIWGNDNAGFDVTTSGTGSREERFEQIWKFQLTGSTTSIDNISIDLSSVLVKPTIAGNYTLLIDDNALFSSPTEISAASFSSEILTFTNVDLSGETFMTVALDPDLDGDGVTDGDDFDDDNDGILDSDEGNGIVDTDGDGIFDSRDLDSDNDGIGDLYESGIEASGTALATLDANGDGIVDAGNVGVNGDTELVYTLSNIDAAVEPSVVPDFRDLDSDQNGISDLAESGRGTGVDADDDGIFEGADTDEDGVPDEIDAEDAVFGSTELFAQDLDSDGTPDFRDNDNDGDLVEDVDEVGLTDTTPDDGFLDGSTDVDGDGILSDRDDNDAVFGQINIVDLLTGTGDDWYSFKTGDWNEPDNWTLDPSGTVRVNPNSLYPSSITDNVFVLNGDEMTLNFNALIVSSVTINDGGIIDAGTTTGHNFNTISGEGTIEIASDDFPAGDASDFISTSGGTVTYVDQSPAVDYEVTTVRTFNNMIVNLSSNTLVLKADYTLNSNLTVNSGTLQVNDNTSDAFTDNTTPLFIIVNGDFSIGASGIMTVGDVDANTEIDARGIYTFHQFELLGDFTNNGSAIFTNLSPASIADGRYRDKYPTAADADNLVGTTIPSTEYGVLEMLFTDGSKDQLITLNGPTDFYRIEIAKGTSQTFIAEFSASSTANFRLLGRIAMDQSDDSDDTPNIDNNRALGLEAGILKLGDNIVIDQIADEDPNGTGASTQGGNRNYIIDLDAQLWIASNAIVTKENDWGIHPFGKLKVSDDGTLTFTGTGQRTILVDNQGVFEMTGGTVDITQYRNKTGADGAPRGSFVMTGGVLNIGEGNADGSHAIFSVPWEDQNFILNADNPAEPPVINVTLDGNRGKDNAAIQIGVTDGNYNVGESEINITHTSNTNYKISSAVPLYNLSYDNSGTGELIISDIIDADDDAPGAGGILPDDNSTTIPTPAQFAQPLVITNNLTITDGRVNANDLDVTIGNIFTISDGGEYAPGTNTTFFNGTSPIQQLLLNGTTPLVGGGFNNIDLSGDGTEKDFGGDIATPVVLLGDLTIGSGVTLNDKGKTIQVNGDITNSGFHITDASSAGKIEVTGGAASHEIGGDGTGQFKILDINDGTNAVSFTADMEVDSVLNLVNGVLDIGTNQLTISSTAAIPIADDLGGTANFDATRMIQTSGNASDGGLSVYVNETESILFPIGVIGKYTPALADFPSFTADGSDDGFVSISPVDAELSTTDLSGGNLLSYYWKVDTLGIVNTDIPRVTFEFTYDNSDTHTGTQLIAVNSYFAGKVLDASPYTRSSEGAVLDLTNVIEFDTPFDLEKANYTAGEANRFVGSPTIYYTRDGVASSVDYQTVDLWSTDQVLQHDGASAGTDYPGPGDIAVIGPGDRVEVNDSDFTVGGVGWAELVINSGTIDFRSNDGHSSGTDNPFDNGNIGVVSGTGTIIFSVWQNEPNFPVGDYGDFVDVVTNVVLLRSVINGSFDFPAGITTFPTLNFFAGQGTNTLTGVRVYNLPSEDIIVNGDFLLRAGAVAQFSNAASGDMYVFGDVEVGSNNQLAHLRFQNSGTERTLTIVGDLIVDHESGGVPSELYVVTGGGNSLEHTIQLGGDFTVSDGAEVDLSADSNVKLELINEVNGTYSTSNISVIPELYRIIMNKGSDQTPTFSLDDPVTLTASSDGSTKQITLQNGTLIVNDPALDFTLNSGAGVADFTIPASAGLNVQDGTVRVAATGTGDGNGLRLDGKLTLSGGDLVMNGGSSADNYIEYGTGGSSEIEITGGNLVVGSQLRRNLLSDDGVINYTQTGGTAVFGVNAAPDDSRGVFEIINSGAANSSSFTLSGASTVFAIVGAQDAPAQGTFILDTDVDVNVSSNAIIDFGYNYNASGAIAGVNVENAASEVYEINSAFALPNVRIDNGNFNAPVVEIVVQDLTITDNLEILNSGSLVSNDFNLTVNSGFTNNGTYTPGTNTTTFNGTSQTIDGTTATSFNNLVINPSTSLTLSNPMTVSGDLSILSGELIDGGNQISLFGDLTIVTESSGTGGISMNGSTSQEINLTDGAAEIDVLRINNSQGVALKDNGGVEVALTIDVNLAIDDGVFSIEDNRLILDNDAGVTSSAGFSETEMISINGVKKSDGVEREFLASTDVASFTIPVGTPGKYTPVTLDVNDSDDPGSILVKPINSIHPSATGLDALNYYWLVTTDPSSVAGFEGDISFQYLESDANNTGQTESTWENNAARLIAPNWSKPTSNLVNIASNTITFANTDLSAGGVTTFDGEYTVGNDIPDLLATYISNSDNTWVNAASWDVDRDGDGLYDEVNGDDDPVAEIPQPGTIVIIDTDDEITMSSTTDNDQNIFSLQIDGTLDIADSDGHNFGDVSGNGVLRVRAGTLPGGNYDNFFTTTAGTLDMGSSDSWTLSPSFTDVRGLILSDGGTKTLPDFSLNIGDGGISISDGSILDNAVNNNNITVDGDVNIINGTFLLGSSAASLAAQNLTLTSGTLTSSGGVLDLTDDLNLSGGTFNAGSATHSLAGDFNYNTAATFNRGSSRITFDGSTDQEITSNGTTLTFHNLRANKSGGSLIVGASTDIDINNRLGLLNSSVIDTEVNDITLRLVGLATYAAGTNGYIVGPMSKDLDDEAASFTFRVGKGSVYKPISITPEDGSYVGDVTWDVEFFDISADGYNSGNGNTVDDLTIIEVNGDLSQQVETILASEFWQINSNGISASLGTISIDGSNNGASLDDIDDQLLQVMAWDESASEWTHLGGTSSGTPTSYNLVSDVSLSFSERIVTAGAESGTTLPVELISFKALIDDNKVTLDWSTATELDNDYFEVQRSVDGIVFESIGEVDGSGTTQELQEYGFSDSNPIIGVSYYRLKQVDFDGIFEFSSLAYVFYDQSNARDTQFKIYPNPSTNGKLIVSFEGVKNEKVQVTLIDQTGKVHFSARDGGYAGDIEIRLPTSSSAGIYLLLIESSQSTQVERVIFR